MRSIHQSDIIFIKYYALKRNKSEHKLFLNQSITTSLQIKTRINAQYRMMEQI